MYSPPHGNNGSQLAVELGTITKGLLMQLNITNRLAAGASPERIRRLNERGLPLIHLVKVALGSIALLVGVVVIFWSLILVAFAWRLA